jgi:hypothetical protein
LIFACSCFLDHLASTNCLSQGWSLLRCWFCIHYPNPTWNPAPWCPLRCNSCAMSALH